MLEQIWARSGLSAVALVALLLAYWAVGLNPFRFELPRYVPNQAEYSEDGRLIFSGPGIVRTDEGPSWLLGLDETKRFQLVLVARTDEPVQSGPARLFSISENAAARNLTVGQDGADLILRFRRPGSTINGTPAYRVPGVFSAPDWHAIVVEAGPGRLRLLVDGKVHADEVLASAPFDDWRDDFPVMLGNEITYGRDWIGQIHTAILQVDDVAIDYLDAASTSIPRGWWEMRRLNIWDFDDRANWYRDLDVYVNFLGFLPFGALVVLISRGRLGVLKIMMYGGLLSLSIESLQILIPVRNPSLSDLLLNTSGAGVGAYLMQRAAANRALEKDGADSI